MLLHYISRLHSLLPTLLPCLSPSLVCLIPPPSPPFSVLPSISSHLNVISIASCISYITIFNFTSSFMSFSFVPFSCQMYSPFFQRIPVVILSIFLICITLLFLAYFFSFLYFFSMVLFTPHFPPGVFKMSSGCP